MGASLAQPTSMGGGRYTDLQRLGGGAMGAVFLAMDQQRHERVAIKVPAASRHWRAEYEKRVLKEIGILSALQHPNIITIQDWGQDPTYGPYIVMEYIEGGSVLQLMARNPGNRLEPYEALRIAATVAEALAYAHSRQPPIIHRDIKPDNILMRRSDGQIKVSDFGLAAVLTGRRAMTQWGTPDYIAPEQALGKGADGRSDMYSLAATLYHMLTGIRPPSLGQPLPMRPSAAIAPGVLHSDQMRRIDFLIITLMAYDPNNRRPAPDRRAWRASEVAEELHAIAERRPAQVYPAPGDSAIFPSLMTGILPPAGVAPRPPAQAPRPQAPQQPFAPTPQQTPPFQPQPAPPQPPAFQPQQASAFQPPPVQPPQQARPLPMPMPQPMPQAQPLPFQPPMPPQPPPFQPPPAQPPRPQAPPQGWPLPQPQPIQPQAQPLPQPQTPHAPPNPAPTQRPLQAEQVILFQPPRAAPPPAQAFRPSNMLPPPGPQTPAAQPAPRPSGGIQPPPPQEPHSGMPPASAKSDKQQSGISATEKELIAGLLVGGAGAASLFLVTTHLSAPLMFLDALFNGLVSGLVLWGIGLIVGLASPRGRRGRMPWLALLVTLLVLAIAVPIAQAVAANQGLFSETTTFLALLLAWPFLFVGAVGTCLAMKMIGR